MSCVFLGKTDGLDLKEACVSMMILTARCHKLAGCTAGSWGGCGGLRIQKFVFTYLFIFKILVWTN